MTIESPIEPDLSAPAGSPRRPLDFLGSALDQRPVTNRHLREIAQPAGVFAGGGALLLGAHEPGRRA
jgi:hypothetical protein